MSSLFDELSEKLNADPRLSKRGGPRFDLSLLLFNARDDLRELWVAADTEITRVKRDGGQPPEPLRNAVERLRPLFGGRSEP